MSSSLFSKIESAYSGLSKSHKKIADYILKDYEKAAFFTAAKLGNVTGISESTVVRFATQLGFDGYPEFQAALQETLKGKLNNMQRIEVAGIQNMNDDILSKVLLNDIASIKDTLNNVSREDFYNASRAVNSADKIYILGVRSSAALANFIYFYFKMVYDNVVLINASASSEMLEEIFKIGPKDVCIAISFPRYSKQVVKTLQYVKDRGGKIIAVTDSIASPIAPISDFVLTAKSNMASFIDSLVAPLSLINALIVAASTEKQDEVLDTFRELETIWDKYGVYEKQEDAADA